MTMRILLADDHKFVRDSLRNLLIQHAKFDIVAEADDGQNAIELTRVHMPDIVIMDVRMPDMNGVEATRQILSEYPQTQIIGISMDTSRQFVQAMLNVGARGYLLKDTAFDELILAIETICDGRIYLSPELSFSATSHSIPEPEVDLTSFTHPDQFSPEDLLDEQLCYNFLCQAIVPTGLSCPQNHPLPPTQSPHDRTKTPILDYKCRTCGKVYNLFTNTVWRGTRYPCSKILLIMRGLLKDESTTQIARALHIDRAHLSKRRQALQTFAQEVFANKKPRA